MLIGILSDTHNRVTRAGRAAALLAERGASALIHCGDYTSPDVVYACAVDAVPLYGVLGNNDFDQFGLRAAFEAVGATWLGEGGELVFDGRRVAVTHGDNPRVFQGLVATPPDYLLFGHSHHPWTERDGPTRQINPGALHRAVTYTIALLDTNSDRVEYIEVV